MAARVDLDRCPSRHFHHVAGACKRQTSLPTLSLLPLPPPPPPPLSLLLLPPPPPNGSSVNNAKIASEMHSVPLKAVANSVVSSVADSAKDSVPDIVKRSVADSVENSVADSAGGAEENTDLALPNPDSSRGVKDIRLREPSDCVAAGGEQTLDASMFASGQTARGGGAASLVGGKVSGGRGVAAAAAAAAATGIPLDRAGGCGLWLRLVIMPLIRECLDGSYRTKLLALHMTQVRVARGAGSSKKRSSFVGGSEQKCPHCP